MLIFKGLEVELKCLMLKDEHLMFGFKLRQICLCAMLSCPSLGKLTLHKCTIHIALAYRQYAKLPISCLLRANQRPCPDAQ